MRCLGRKLRLLCAIFCTLLGCVGASRLKPAHVDPDAVTKVHLVFSNHVDIGFADYASNILNRYVLGGPGTLGPPHPRNQTVHYDSFLLSAAHTADKLREKNASKGAPRFRYMTQAYVASYFANCTVHYPHVPQGNPLRCPNSSQLEIFSRAVANGDIFWHAFPHNAEPELMDAPFFEWAVKFSRQLASRFKSPTAPRVLSQRDVPGLTRASIPSLTSQGVIGVSVGINDGSPPPIVPSTSVCYSGERQIRTPFVWEDVETGASLIADFHPGGYGGVLPINPAEGVPYYSRDGVLCDCLGIDGFSEVLCYAWKGDNYGGANTTQTELNFDVFQKAFPNAQEIVASTMGEFWSLLEKHRDSMEVITSEIGDTWIYGASSDPLKLATMRYMMRARRSLVRFTADTIAVDDNLFEFNRLLLKLPEHTWGSCGSAHMHIQKPIDVWTANELEAAIKKGDDPFYDVVQASWNEQRLFMKNARSAAADNAELADLLDKEKEILSAKAPTSSFFAESGYNVVAEENWADSFAFKEAGIEVSFDVDTGSMMNLINHNTGTVWASSSPMFRFTYRSHSYSEAKAYAAIYKYSHGGKYPHIEPNGIPWPGMNRTSTIARNWKAPICEMWIRNDSIAIEQHMPHRPSSLGYGPPEKIWFIYSFSASMMVDLELVWKGKRPTRLRESIWLEMRPSFDKTLDWTLFIDKLGQKVNSSDVVKLGGATLHGMDPAGGISFEGYSKYGGKKSSLIVTSLDCGLVAPGSNFNIWNVTAYDTNPVAATDGLAFDLYSNLYAVNYPMWYPWIAEDDVSRFRFKIFES